MYLRYWRSAVVTAGIASCSNAAASGGTIVQAVRDLNLGNARAALSILRDHGSTQKWQQTPYHSSVYSPYRAAVVQAALVMLTNVNERTRFELVAGEGQSHRWLSPLQLQATARFSHGKGNVEAWVSGALPGTNDVAPAGRVALRVKADVNKDRTVDLLPNAEVRLLSADGRSYVSNKIDEPVTGAGASQQFGFASPATRGAAKLSVPADHQHFLFEPPLPAQVAFEVFPGLSEAQAFAESPPPALELLCRLASTHPPTAQQVYNVLRVILPALTMNYLGGLALDPAMKQQAERGLRRWQQSNGELAIQTHSSFQQGLSNLQQPYAIAVSGPGAESASIAVSTPYPGHDAAVTQRTFGARATALHSNNYDLFIKSAALAIPARQIVLVVSELASQIVLPTRDKGLIVVQKTPKETKAQLFPGTPQRLAESFKASGSAVGYVDPLDN